MTVLMTSKRLTPLVITAIVKCKHRYDSKIMMNMALRNKQDETDITPRMIYENLLALKEVIKNIQLEQISMRAKLDELIEYQNLIVLSVKDVAKIFEVTTKTVYNWLETFPHLALNVGGKFYVTISNIKLLVELQKNKAEAVKKNLPKYLKKINSPTEKLLREYIFGNDNDDK